MLAKLKANWVPLALGAAGMALFLRWSLKNSPKPAGIILGLPSAPAA